jgi:hypothetical protein
MVDENKRQNTQKFQETQETPSERSVALRQVGSEVSGQGMSSQDNSLLCWLLLISERRVLRRPETQAKYNRDCT